MLGVDLRVGGPGRRAGEFPEQRGGLAQCLADHGVHGVLHDEVRLLALTLVPDAVRAFQSQGVADECFLHDLGALGGLDDAVVVSEEVLDADGVLVDLIRLEACAHPVVLAAPAELLAAGEAPGAQGVADAERLDLRFTMTSHRYSLFLRLPGSSESLFLVPVFHYSHTVSSCGDHGPCILHPYRVLLAQALAGRTDTALPHR